MYCTRRFPLSEQGFTNLNPRPGEVAGKCIVGLQFSIQAYALFVVYVAAIVSLRKIVQWAIRTYHP
jgi:hypothetical protein